jgi:glycerol uptake facilitator protein
MIEFFSEFIGTAILVLLGNGSVANVCLKQTKGHNAGTLFITIGWGLAVFVAVVVSQKYSGAHLNPAVTLGLALANLFPWAKVLPFMAAQFLGGAFGAFLVWLFYLDHFKKTEDKASILGCFSTGPAIKNYGINLFSEILGTFVLVFTIMHFSGAEIMSKGTEMKVGLGSLGAVPVSLLVVAIGIALGGTTGYAINPARDLSPRLMHALLPMPTKGDSNWSYSWIPVLGPVLGTLLVFLVMSVYGA